jgi:hypothetical protein
VLGLTLGPVLGKEWRDTTEARSIISVSEKSLLQVSRVEYLNKLVQLSHFQRLNAAIILAFKTVYLGFHYAGASLTYHTYNAYLSQVCKWFLEKKR